MAAAAGIGPVPGTVRVTERQFYRKTRRLPSPCALPLLYAAEFALAFVILTMNRTGSAGILAGEFPCAPQQRAGKDASAPSDYRG